MNCIEAIDKKREVPAYKAASRLGDGKPHALLIEPPISPYDTCPPLGPALLARSAARRGLRVTVDDWNKRYLNSVIGQIPESRGTTAVGDHGKDRVQIKYAVENHLTQTGLAAEEPFNVPDGADPARGMHYGFEAIYRALERAKKSSFWGEWIEDVLTSKDGIPPVVGLSVMGPEQVFPALLLMSAIKDRAPETVTVMGGSHPTLLRDEIKKDPRYTHDGEGRRLVDAVLPGHSEEAFAALVGDVVHDRYVQGRKTHVGPLQSSDVFDYLPLFSPEQIGLYDPTTLSLPLQFTKGCSYGGCTHCTYPEIESKATPRTGFDAGRARDAIAALTERFGVQTYSTKDSLLTLYWMSQLGEQLLRNGPKDTKWSASTKAVRALGNRASEVASFGATTLEMGVESIIEHSLAVLKKRNPNKDEIEEIVLALAAEGVTPVVNLMFGIPGETESQAESQLEWFLHLQQLAREQDGAPVEGSLNMLLLTKGAPLVAKPPEGVVIQEAAPWAYVQKWNEPTWRRKFGQKLAEVQMQEA